MGLLKNIALCFESYKSLATKNEATCIVRGVLIAFLYFYELSWLSMAAP